MVDAHGLTVSEPLAASWLACCKPPASQCSIALCSRSIAWSPSDRMLTAGRRTPVLPRLWAGGACDSRAPAGHDGGCRAECLLLWGQACSLGVGGGAACLLLYVNLLMQLRMWWRMCPLCRLHLGLGEWLAATPYHCASSPRLFASLAAPAVGAGAPGAGGVGEAGGRHAGAGPAAPRHRQVSPREGRVWLGVTVVGEAG